MYCASCGTNLVDPQQFCPTCGARISSQATVPNFRESRAPSSGRELSLRLLALGDLRGKSADQLIEILGPPSSISSMAAGRTLVQWQRTSYHVALLFDARGQFVKITHEYAHQAPSGCMVLLTVIFLILAALALSSFSLVRAIPK